MKAEVIVVKRVSCEGCSNAVKGDNGWGCDLNKEVEVWAGGIPSGCPLPDWKEDTEQRIITALKKGDKHNGD